MSSLKKNFSCYYNLDPVLLGNNEKIIFIVTFAYELLKNMKQLQLQQKLLKNSSFHVASEIDILFVLTPKTTKPAAANFFITYLVLLSYLSIILKSPCDFREARFQLLYAKSSIFKFGIVVPTPLEGGGTIYSNGFFLFSKFWPIDIFIIES